MCVCVCVWGGLFWWGYLFNYLVFCFVVDLVLLLFVLSLFLGVLLVGGSVYCFVAGIFGCYGELLLLSLPAFFLSKFRAFLRFYWEIFRKRNSKPPSMFILQII